jgi:hypothetical protein
MPNYLVTITVNFTGGIEAESAKEAEELAWTSWGDTYDSLLTYDSVENIDVEEEEE